MRPLDPWTMPLVGTSLIEASAGTGKTYTLTTLYLRLLVEEDLAPEQILVVTYTQAATAELRTRVRKRIQQAIEAGERAAADAERGDPDDAEEAQLRRLGLAARERAISEGRADPLRRALQDFDQAAIFTIHGFCQRTLQENAFESGLAFDTELVEKSEGLERTLAHDLHRRLLTDEHPSFVEWLALGAGRRWHFEPEALHDGLIRVLGADEEMPVLPDLSGAVPRHDVEADVAGVAGALGDWAKRWVTQRAAVTELLLGDNDLNGNKYRSKTIADKWLPELDALARRVAEAPDAASTAALALPDWFEKLTRNGLAAGTKKGGTPIDDPVFDHFDAVFAAVRTLDAARDERALWLRHRFVAAAREEAARRRSEQHRFFFDDLLSELRRALRGEGGAGLAARLRERHRFALIDEFQDTDPVQYDIFRKVWHAGETPHHRGLVLVGDPKQAIYSFRGADVFTYLAAKADAGEDVWGLEVNWRSDPGLIAAVNALFTHRAHAFQLDAIGFSEVAPRPGFEPEFDARDRPAAGFRVLLAGREEVGAATGEEFGPKTAMPLRHGRRSLMEALAADVVALLESGATIDGHPISPRDIAFLCRRKSELAQARRALEALGVPCVDRGDADVFESREARELARVLRAMLRSGDPATLRAALATGAHGLVASELAALSDDSPELAAISERFAEYARIWSQSGFGRALETWRRREGITPRLLGYRDGERRATNWRHLAELLQRLASERSPSRAGLVAALERAIVSEEAREDFGTDASLLRLERDDHAVSLVTLHRSKGLEYPIVYLPSLWEDPAPRSISVEAAADDEKPSPPVRFHDAETGRRTLDLGGHPEYADHVARQKAESFSEQLRLLYVGLTRARHQCVVGWGAFGQQFQKTALAWLLDGADADAADAEKAEKARKAWTDEDWRDAWARIAERGAPGAIALEAMRFETRERWSTPEIARPALAFAAPTRRFDAPRRTTSFSALTREGRRVAASSGPDVTGRDVDAGGGVPESGPGERPAAESPAVATAPDLAAEMHAFPRGAAAGTLLHDVLEAVDLSEIARRGGADDVTREIAETRVARGRLDSGHVEQVLHVVDSVACTPLRSEPVLRLGDVARGRLRAEMEFTLVTPGGDGARGFSPTALQALLAEAPAGSPLARYAERAGRMGFRRLNGFLRGFIDAVFHDGERYYLLDYKSNHLGDRQVDYAPDALVEPMVEHDYVLQYLVYAIALDRHLGRRLSGYDYDRHFGGVYYLFLRGLAREHTPECGVFFDRPPLDIVRGASALMGLPDAALAGGTRA